MSSKKEKTDGVKSSSGSRVLRKARSFKDELKTKIIRRTPSSAAQRPLSPGSLPPLSLNKSPKTRRKLTRGSSFNEASQTDRGPHQTEENDVENLETKGKGVQKALRYVEDVVQKNILQLLPGSATVVLETLIELYHCISTYNLHNDSSAILARYNQVCVNMGQFIRWADRILLNGPSSLDKQEADAVIANLQEALEELIKQVVEKLSKKATVRHVQSYPSKPTSLTPHRASIPNNSGLPDVPLTPRELEILEETSRMSVMSHSADDLLDLQHTPPPKPPLPPAWQHPPNHSDLHTHVPPPLPAKRRMTASHDSASSMFSDHSTPTLQSPSQLEGSTCTISRSARSSLDISPHDTTPLSQSPTSSVSSAFSASSEDLLADRSHNHSVTSSPSKSFTRNSHDSDSIHSLTQKIDSLTIDVTQNRKSTGSSSGSDVGVPPLPEKRPGPPARSPSLYDNVPVDSEHRDSICSVNSEHRDSISSMHYRDSTDNMQHRDSVELRQSRSSSVASNSSMLSYNRSAVLLEEQFILVSPHSLSTSAIDSSQGPPPLPPKKKTIHDYMHMFGQDQCPKLEEIRHSIHSVNFYQSQWFQHQMELMPNPTRSNTISVMSSISSGLSSDVYSLASGSSGEDSQGTLHNDLQDPHLPPSLPPKEYNDKKFTPLGSQVAGSRYSDPGLSAELDDDDDEESGIQDITSESTSSSDPQSSNRTSTGSSIRPSSPDVHKDADSDFSETCVLDEEEVYSQLVKRKQEEDGPEIRGGTVDALVVHACTVGKSDFLYQEAFLTTYRTFITPRDLIDKLLYRYSRFSKINEVSKKKLSRNAFAFLVRVVDELCMEVDVDVLLTLMDLEYQLLCDAELQLAKLLRQKTLEKEEQRKQLQLASQQITLLSAYQLSSKQYALTDFKSEQIAEQMTLLDAQLFQKIEIPEVLLWAREQNEEHSPNLTKFTEHFNKMSYWCRTRIIEHQDDPRERERYLIKFIKVMKHLRKLNNFNSYLAILSALDSAPIRRLEWQKQNLEALCEFCHLIDSSSSFRAYRQALAETEPPCIPYIGLILQDLTFVHIGNQDYLPDGQINFAKRWQQFHILDNMKRFKKSNYEIKKNQKILTYFDNFSNYLCEESLWQISETIKPRGGKK